MLPPSEIQAVQLLVSYSEIVTSRLLPEAPTKSDIVLGYDNHQAVDAAPADYLPYSGVLTNTVKAKEKKRLQPVHHRSQRWKDYSTNIYVRNGGQI